MKLGGAICVRLPLASTEATIILETAEGAGTKVTLRVPKFAPGVHA